MVLPENIFQKQKLTESIVATFRLKSESVLKYLRLSSLKSSLKVLMMGIFTVESAIASSITPR